MKAAFVLLAMCGVAAAAQPLRLNPFNDPFLPATTGALTCAAPLGPAYTDAEIRVQAHSRAERGTTCWLAGRCSEPNAYRYDAPIARAVVAALRGDAALAGTRIWVTVQRRFVTLEGCVADGPQAARAEALARGAADVDLVIPMLASPGEAPRYRVAFGVAR